MPSQKDAILGKLAVERSYLTQECLDEAFQLQRKMHDEMGMDESLEHVLVAKHWLTNDQAHELRNAAAVETGEARLVAGYEVASKLGQGGMGAVYKARRIGTPDFVALKILPPSLANEAMIARFRRESEIVRKLHHENIVACIEFGYDKRRRCHFCALELVQGEDLWKRIKRLGKLSEDEALSITTQITSALQHAYYNGLVHRDVKPDNIMVTPDGTAKLLDLGLARPASKEVTRLTESQMVLGSPYYISPEQAKAEKEVDIRSDIYSLGATLYHMVTGKPPFKGTTPMAILQKHVSEKLPWPGEANPDLSDGLCRIIAKMMEKAPEDRYETPNDLHRDLDLLIEGNEPEIQDAALKNSSVKVPAVRPKRRGRPRARARAARERERKHRKPAERKRREERPGRKKPESVREHRREAGREAAGKASGWSALPTGAKIAIPAAASLLIALVLGSLVLSRGRPPRRPPRVKPPDKSPEPVAKIRPRKPQKKQRKSKPTPPPGARPSPPPPGEAHHTVLGPERDKKADEEYFAKLRREAEERAAGPGERARIVTETGRDQPYEQDAGPDGVVLIEAEDFSAKADAGAHRWEPVTSPRGYSGRGAMKALPDTGTQVGDELAERCPRLDYKISFVKTGTHYLWVRMFGVAYNGDSCHGGLDGEAVSSLRHITTNTVGRYYWEGRRWEQRATFEIAAPGVHTINIFMREDGTIVDAIAVTTNPKWTPAGITAIPTTADAATQELEATPPQPPDLTRGLVGWWKFDEGKGAIARDSSGRGNDGTVKGGAKWAKGKLGGALEFDGRDDYVQLPGGFADFARGFTFAVWAYPTAAKNYARFIDIGNGAASDNILFTRVASSGSLALEVYQGNLRGSLGSKDVVTLNSWQHFVGTLDASGQATVYRDGVEIASGRIRLPPNATRTSNYIGRSNWASNSLYQGLTDDFRIYNRALSVAEVKALAAMGSGTPSQALGRRDVAPSRTTATLSGFDSLLDRRDYAGARTWAERAARDPANAGQADLLGAAARVAGELEARRQAVRHAVEACRGKKITLLTTKGKYPGKVEEVSDSEIALAVEVAGPGKGSVQTRATVKWAELTRQHEGELAEEGGWKAAGPDAQVALAYLALGRKDSAAATKALQAAGEHPLTGHITEKMTDLGMPAEKAARRPRDGPPEKPKIVFRADLSMKLYPIGRRYGSFPTQATDDPTGPFDGKAVYFNQKTGKDVVYEIRSRDPLICVRFKGAAMQKMTIEILDSKGKVAARAGPFGGGNKWGEFALRFAPRRTFLLRIRNHISTWFLIKSLTLERALPPEKSRPKGAATGRIDLTRDLVGHWKFDDGRGTTARDSSRSGSHGTVKGGAKWVKGKIANALSFDGVDEHVTTGLNIDQSDNSPGVTFAAWVNPASTRGDHHCVIGSDNGGWDWTLARDGTLWCVWDGGGNRSTGVSVDVGVWQHVAAVFDPYFRKVRFYKNGVETVISSLDFDGGDNNISIGTHRPNGGAYFDGLIDDVRIYSRALSAEEVKALRSSSLGPQPPSITSTAPEIAAVDVPYAYRINTAGNPAPKITVKGLPDWLKFDGKDTITGTPGRRKVGVATMITVTATSKIGSDKQRFPIKVRKLDLTRGLVGHWKLDDTRGTFARDSSGRNHHGIVKGAKWVKGKIGGALSFDGRDDLLALAGNAEEGFMHDEFSQRTITMWVNASATTGVMELFDEGGGTNGLALRLNAGRVEAAVRGDKSQNTVQTDYGAPGTWRYVAAVFDRGTCRLYVDGLAKATASAAYPTIGVHGDDGGLAARSSADAFGGTASGDHFRGMLDDVRIYDRALSAEEVKALAASK